MQEIIVLIEKIQKVMVSSTYVTVYIFGTISLSYWNFETIVLFGLLFGFTAVIDVLLGWYLSVIGKRNTSSALKK